MSDEELLALHREIVAVPSLSGEEGPLCVMLGARLAARGVAVQRFENNLYATCGRGPLLCFNTHLDTVPPGAGWTRAPHEVSVVDGRVYGLGSNDAKASVAAMVAAFVRLAARGPELGFQLLLTLAAQEEVGGKGSERLLPELAQRGLTPEAAVVGEPTGLDIAIAQKGLLICELIARGRACHAAHGRALGAPNAIRLLARDLVALEAADLGPDHPKLGPVTMEPTIVKGGSARNSIPAEASCLLDLRINPEPGPREIAARLAAAVTGELRVVSDRLRPYEVAASDPIVAAAQAARPQAKLLGSRGLSDLVFFGGIPGVKAGPGMTERSHTADEFVLESEVLEGARFYEALALAWGAGRAA